MRKLIIVGRVSAVQAQCCTSASALIDASIEYLHATYISKGFMDLI